MATKSQDIELVIRSTDLSSKPLDQIGDAVDKLAKATEALEPAAKRGEVSLKELQNVAGKLEKALAGLAKNQALIERFQKLNTELEEGRAELSRMADQVDRAGKALNEAVKPTKELEKALSSAQKQFAAQERSIGRTETALAKMSERAKASGIDLADTAASQKLLDTAVNNTIPVYQRVTALIDNYGKIQRDLADDLRVAAKAQKEAADTATFQRQADDAKKLVQASEYVRFWTQALETKDAAERRAADTALFQKEVADATKLRDASRYIRFWTDALEKKETVERQAADSGKLLADFRAVGTAAEQAALKVGRASVKIDELAVSNAKAGDSVRRITDPVSVLSKTVAGLETVLNGSLDAQAKFQKELDKTGKSTVDVRAELQNLSRVQSGATSIAALADRFAATRDAATGAATELRKARAEVLGYAQAVQRASEPSEALVAALRESEARLAAAERRYQTFATAAQQLRASLQSAGVNTRDLANEITRLEGVAGKAVTATNELTAAQKRLGEANGKIGFGLLNTGGRTTLSLFQRLRGEALSLTATFVGLYGAINGIGSVLDAVQQRASTQARLSVAFGADQVGPELEYVRGQAERLGLELPKLANSYSKFAIASTSAGNSLKDTRFVFESFAEVGKVFQLTEENIAGVFNAIEQVFSKGTVQAEELRGQLGDRLAGSFYEFAKALGQTTGTFTEWLKNGQVTSDFVLLFADQFRNKVAPQLNDATKSTASSIARFNTALNDLKLVVADSGFLEAFTEGVRKLTEYLKSEEGTQFADSLGKGLTKVAEAFIFLLDNIETFTTVVQTLAGVWATVFAVRMVADIASATKSFLDFAAVVKVQSPLLAAALGTIGPALAAGFLGFQLGTYLYNEFAIVRKAGALLIGYFQTLGTVMSASAKIAATEFVGFWEDNLIRLYNYVRETLQKVLVLTADFARKLGLDSVADDLIAKAAGLAEKHVEGIGARSKIMREQLVKDLAEIKRITSEMVADADAAPTAAETKKAVAQQKASPAAADTTGLDEARRAELLKKLSDMTNGASKADLKAAEKAAKERIAIEDKVREELARIEDTIQKKDSDTLAERMIMIERSYREVFENIEKLEKANPGVGLAARARLEELITLRKIQETEKFRIEQSKKGLQEIKDSEQAVNDLVSVRDAQISAINDQQKAGLLTEQEARTRIADINNTSLQAIREGAANTIAMIDALKDPEVQANLAGIRAHLDGIVARAIELPKVLITSAQILDQWADGLTGVAEALFDVTAETGSLADGFDAALQAFRKFASDFLREIALMILKQMLLNALKSNPYTAGAASLFSAATGTAHTGARIGHSVMSTRQISPAVFANARRYHSGGPVGLRRDEVPLIAQTGEEVLSRTDPRNAANGGGATPQVNVKNVNLFNPVDALTQALNTADGEQAVMNVVHKNRDSIR